LDWKTVGVIGVLGLVFFALFGSAIMQNFAWEAADVIDESEPGKPKYYYVMVRVKLKAWKTWDGRQGGVDVLEYDVKGYVTSSIPNFVTPPSGEFQVKVQVYVDGVCKLNKKFSLPEGTHEIVWYYDAGLGMHSVRLVVVEYWWNMWGLQQDDEVKVDQQYYINLVRLQTTP